MEISFTIPGPPVAKARVKTVPLRKCLKCGKTGMGFPCRYCGGVSSEFVTNIPYTPKQTTNYESLVRLCASEAMTGREKLVGPVRMTMEFYFPVPKTRAKKLMEGEPHTQKPDLSNVVKSVEDGCLGVVFHDDCTVFQYGGTTGKYWTHGAARCEVRISEVNVADGILSRYVEGI